MSFFDYIILNWSRIGFLLIQHIEAVLIAVGIATVISLIVAFSTERLPIVRRTFLSTTSTFLTIPSFALFGLMIPLFGLGVAPTILALTVYAIYPILRNAVTGLDNVPPGLIDAARGMGMNPFDRLIRVKLPLAWPVIMNGIRVATIMVVATAAIGAAVRGPGLGELIFTGLSRIGGANSLNEALSGVIGIVIVAGVLDFVFVLIGRVTTPKGLNV